MSSISRAHPTAWLFDPTISLSAFRAPLRRDPSLCREQTGVRSKGECQLRCESCLLAMMRLLHYGNIRAKCR